MTLKFLIPTALILLYSCSKGSKNSAPSVTTASPTNVTDSSATLNGSVTGTGGQTITDCGFRSPTPERL